MTIQKTVAPSPKKPKAKRVTVRTKGKSNATTETNRKKVAKPRGDDSKFEKGKTTVTDALGAETKVKQTGGPADLRLKDTDGSGKLDEGGSLDFDSSRFDFTELEDGRVELVGSDLETGKESFVEELGAQDEVSFEVETETGLKKVDFDNETDALSIDGVPLDLSEPTAPPEKYEGATKDAYDLHEHLHGGFSGLGTEEIGVMKVLRNKTPEQSKAIQEEYQLRYNAPLEDDLKADLENPRDEEAALSYLSGDHARGDALRLVRESEKKGPFESPDQGNILGILKDADDQRRQDIAGQVADITGKTGGDNVQVLKDLTLPLLGQAEKVEADALLQTAYAPGSADNAKLNATATKQEVTAALGDPSRVMRELEAVPPEQQKALAQDAEFVELLRGKLDRPRFNEAYAILEGNPTGKAAAKLDFAIHAKPPDKGLIRGELQGQSPEFLQNVNDAYFSQTKQKLDEALGSVTSGQEKEIFLAMASPEPKSEPQQLTEIARDLNHAVKNNYGQDVLGRLHQLDQMMPESTWEKKVQALDGVYFQEHGGSLKDAVGKLSGPDKFESEYLLQSGVPTTPEETLAKEKARAKEQDSAWIKPLTQGLEHLFKGGGKSARDIRDHNFDLAAQGGDLASAADFAGEQHQAVRGADDQAVEVAVEGTILAATTVATVGLGTAPVAAAFTAAKAGTMLARAGLTASRAAKVGLTAERAAKVGLTASRAQTIASSAGKIATGAAIGAPTRPIVKQVMLGDGYDKKPLGADLLMGAISGGGNMIPMDKLLPKGLLGQFKKVLGRGDGGSPEKGQVVHSPPIDIADIKKLSTSSAKVPLGGAPDPVALDGFLSTLGDLDGKIRASFAKVALRGETDFADLGTIVDKARQTGTLENVSKALTAADDLVSGGKGGRALAAAASFKDGTFQETTALILKEPRLASSLSRAANISQEALRDATEIASKIDDSAYTLPILRGLTSETSGKLISKVAGLPVERFQQFEQLITTIPTTEKTFFALGAAARQGDEVFENTFSVLRKADPRSDYDNVASLLGGAYKSPVEMEKLSATLSVQSDNAASRTTRILSRVSGGNHDKLIQTLALFDDSAGLQKALYLNLEEATLEPLLAHGSKPLLAKTSSLPQDALYRLADVVEEAQRLKLAPKLVRTLNSSLDLPEGGFEGVLETLSRSSALGPASFKKLLGRGGGGAPKKGQVLFDHPLKPEAGLWETIASSRPEYLPDFEKIVDKAKQYGVTRQVTDAIRHAGDDRHNLTRTALSALVKASDLDEETFKGVIRLIDRDPWTAQSLSAAAKASDGSLQKMTEIGGRLVKGEHIRPETLNLLAQTPSEPFLTKIAALSPQHLEDLTELTSKAANRKHLMIGLHGAANEGGEVFEKTFSLLKSTARREDFDDIAALLALSGEVPGSVGKVSPVLSESFVQGEAAFARTLDIFRKVVQHEYGALAKGLALFDDGAALQDFFTKTSTMNKRAVQRLLSGGSKPLVDHTRGMSAAELKQLDGILQEGEAVQLAPSLVMTLSTSLEEKSFDKVFNILSRSHQLGQEPLEDATRVLGEAVGEKRLGQTLGLLGRFTDDTLPEASAVLKWVRDVLPEETAQLTKLIERAAGFQDDSLTKLVGSMFEARFAGSFFKNLAADFGQGLDDDALGSLIKGMGMARPHGGNAVSETADLLSQVRNLAGTLDMRRVLPILEKQIQTDPGQLQELSLAYSRATSVQGGVRTLTNILERLHPQANSAFPDTVNLLGHRALNRDVTTFSRLLSKIKAHSDGDPSLAFMELRALRNETYRNTLAETLARFKNDKLISPESAKAMEDLARMRPDDLDRLTAIVHVAGGQRGALDPVSAALTAAQKKSPVMGDLAIRALWKGTKEGADHVMDAAKLISGNIKLTPILARASDLGVGGVWRANRLATRLAPLDDKTLHFLHRITDEESALLFRNLSEPPGSSAIQRLSKPPVSRIEKLGQLLRTLPESQKMESVLRVAAKQAEDLNQREIFDNTLDVLVRASSRKDFDNIATLLNGPGGEGNIGKLAKILSSAPDEVGFDRTLQLLRHRAANSTPTQLARFLEKVESTPGFQRLITKTDLETFTTMLSFDSRQLIDGVTQLSDQQLTELTNIMSHARISGLESRIVSAMNESAITTSGLGHAIKALSRGIELGGDRLQAATKIMEDAIRDRKLNLTLMRLNYSDGLSDPAWV